MSAGPGPDASTTDVSTGALVVGLLAAVVVAVAVRWFAGLEGNAAVGSALAAGLVVLLVVVVGHTVSRS